MTKPYNKIRCFKLHTKFNLDEIDELRKIAKLKNTDVSKLIRYYIQKGIENEKSS